MDLNEKWLPEKSEDMPTISLATSFFTKYIWRGWNLGDEPVMQTDSSISWKGFTFDFWTNYSMNNDKTKDEGRYQEFTEVDYNIDYTLNFGEMSEMMYMEIPEILEPLSMSAGYTYYTFPNVDWDDKYFDSHEVYIGASYHVLLQPSFTWYWDVGHGKGNSDGGGHGSYFVVGIGHTFDFDNDITADLGMTIGYNDEQWTNKSGWSDMVFSGGVNMPVFGYFMITPSLSYSLILDRDTFSDASENEFYGGITIGFEY
jgi:hypothetical protein